MNSRTVLAILAITLIPFDSWAASNTPQAGAPGPSAVERAKAKALYYVDPKTGYHEDSAKMEALKKSDPEKYAVVRKQADQAKQTWETQQAKSAPRAGAPGADEVVISGKGIPSEIQFSKKKPAN